MAKPKLIAFDLDGTLVNTLDDIAEAVNRALRAYGVRELSNEELMPMIGYSTDTFFARAVPEDRKDLLKPVGAAYMQYYSEHCTDLAKPYEGIPKALEELHQEGILLAVVSNKTHKESLKTIADLFEKDRFNFVLGRMERFPKKPAPDMLRFAMDYLHVKPEETVYVGDSEVDINFAKAAGVDCLSVSWGYRTREQLIESGAVKLIDTVSDLVPALLKR